MQFVPERLVQLRKSLNISKAEAARRLNISAMAYGRYERGERTPSYPSVRFIAHTFNCDPDFLYGLSDDMAPDHIVVSRADSPDLYPVIIEMQNNKDFRERVLEYADYLKQHK